MTTTSSSRKSPLVRWYYSIAALGLIALMLWGFKDFFFSGRAYPNREITPPIRGLIIVHGIAMALWMLLLFIQPLLVATNKKRQHMALGRAGAVLAGVVLVVGLFVAVYSARVAPPDNMLWGMNRHQFMAVPFFGVLLFAAFVGIGIWFRRRPPIHRAMMLTGTFAAMSAAVSRIDPLNALYLGTPWERHFGPFFVAQVVMGLLLILRCAVTRSFDRWLATGFVTLTAACAFVMWFARTDAWSSFATMLAP